MLAQFHHLVGPSAINWLIIAGAGAAFLAAPTLLPALLRRLSGRSRKPLL